MNLGVGGEVGHKSGLSKLLFHMKHKLEGVSGQKLGLSRLLFHTKHKLEGVVDHKLGLSRFLFHMKHKIFLFPLPLKLMNFFNDMFPSDDM